MTPAYRNPRFVNSLTSFGALACCLIAGCTPGPKYIRPASVPPPPAYKTALGLPEAKNGISWSVAAPDDAAVRGDWWTLFGDRDLDDLESKAIAANQTLKAAFAAYQQAREVVRQASAAYYPTVSAAPSAAIQRLNTSQLQIPGFDKQTLNRFKAIGSVAWELDLWGKVRKEVESDAAAAQASAADIANVRLEIEAELATDYFQIGGLDAELADFKKTIADNQSTVELTKEKQQYGVASQVDIDQAQLQLTAVLVQAQDLAVQRGQYEDAIAVLVGKSAPSFTLSPRTLPVQLPHIPTGLPSELLQRRPDVATAERQAAQANAKIGLAKVAYYPSLSLSATAGYSSNHVSNLVDWADRAWTLGASATEVLFDGGSRKAQVKQAEAAYDQTAAQYRATVLTAFQEVQDNLTATQTLAGETLTQQQAVLAAQSSDKLVSQRLGMGNASSIDLVSSQNTVLANQQTALSLRARQFTTTVQLIKALGGGWDETQLLPTKNVKK